jgi:hypothetical protein
LQTARFAITLLVVLCSLGTLLALMIDRGNPPVALGALGGIGVLAGFVGWTIIGMLRKRILRSPLLAPLLKRIKADHAARTGNATVRVVPLVHVAERADVFEAER